MVLDSFLVDMIYQTDRFTNVEPCLHPRNESHLVMMDNPFNVQLDSICQDLVEGLASIFIREIGL